MIIVDNQTIALKRITAWDKYKEPLAYMTYELSARVTNQIQRTTNQAGKEVITNLTISIRAAELKRSEALQVLYSDEFSFVDEFGNETRRVPQNISPARGFSGSSSFVRIAI
ncbi:hypothetical protein AJGP001_10800 [Planococcus faecalis]|uniref:Uncharacterized protein n=1 Tax=Planococcus faecalis TaxID=1598147 RepID=A0ABM6ITN0_9BACL|nr:hypothetical protein [Planococcus faecalis]AQU79722.1 hypothetical protein AJGP001_10800 [Planococcus faecalis]